MDSLCYRRTLLGAKLRIIVSGGDIVRVHDVAPATPRALPLEADTIGYVCVRLEGRLIRLRYILPSGALA